MRVLLYGERREVKLLAAVVLAVAVYAALAFHFTRDEQTASWQPCSPPTTADSWLIVVAPDGTRHPMCIGASTELLLGVTDEAYAALTAGGNAAGLNGVYNIGRDGVFTTNARPVGQP